MSNHTIPEVLRDAARIFLTELEGHIAYIRSALAEADTINFDPAALQRRFHLIRGASGFLGMKALHSLATEAEHLYRDQGVTLSSSELKSKTAEYLASLETALASLGTELRTELKSGS